MAKTTVLVPGAVLKGLLESYHIPVAKISEDIGLSPSAIRQLINNKLKISIIIALKLAKYFDKKPEYWINLQTSYDLSQLLNDVQLKAIPKAQKQAAPAPKKAKAAGAKGSAKDSAKKGPKPKAGAKVAVAAARKPMARAKAKPAPDSK